MVLGLAATGALAAAIAAPSSAKAPHAHATAACTKATNIEAIIDDSGSMSLTDTNRLRVQAMDLLINALPSADGSRDEVKADPQAREIYLGA